MKFYVKTDYPIAYESLDHIEPCGTKNDNSRWKPFNQKLYDLYLKNNIYILDLGCAGGGFVKDCLDDGRVAIGLEGSDYSLRLKRAEWATIPDNLFTCDVTKPFTIYEINLNEDGFPARFDVITGWEFLEHIKEEDLPQLFENCKAHLKPKGLMIFSINTHPQKYHVTLKDKDWWLETFKKNGLKNNEKIVKYFGDDWIRGPKQNAIGSFHVVLSGE